MTRFLKFLCVGVLGTAIDFTLFYLFYIELGWWGLIVSNALSYGAGLTISFFINRAWTFFDTPTRHHGQLWLSLFYGYLGLVINTSVVWFLALLLPVFISKVLAVGVIVVYNYVINKYVVFRVT